jgi:mersacidin/lichenicidin family type 2 lantibiotic
MKKQDIIRAWRDPKYRRSLSAAQQAQLPEHPAEWMVKVEDSTLASVTGGCCYPGHPLYSTGPGYCSALCTPCPPKQCF